MRKPLLIGSIIVVVVGAFYALTRHGESISASTAVASEANPSAVPTTDTSPRPLEASGRNARYTAGQLEPYRCRTAARECLYDPLSAGSEQEAAWLIANGYPSRAELERLTTMSVDQLAGMAAKGDTKAEVFLGKALVFQGKRSEGLGRIADASVKGNVYASYALAEMHAADGASPNPVLSAAYHRLAYLQGDWKATSIPGSAGHGLDVLEAAMSDRRAMALYRNLLEEKGRSGQRLSISPRPE